MKLETQRVPKETQRVPKEAEEAQRGPKRPKEGTQSPQPHHQPSSYKYNLWFGAAARRAKKS